MASGFNDIAWLSFPGPDHRGLLLMLAAYFDDSGTHDSSRIVTWGGFIATSEQWGEFDQAWRAKLAEPLLGKPRLAKFSLSKCDGGHDAFVDYSIAERDLVQAEFRQIIVDHRLLGMAYAVDRQAWDRLATSAAKDHFGDAETICFSSCFNGAIERALEYFPSEKQLSLHFDKGRMSPKLNAIVDHVEARYYGLPELVNIGFDVVEHVTPLQSADIIATENYWHAQGVINGNAKPRPHLDHFLKRVSTEGYILDEPQIIETLTSGGFLPASEQPS
jgi:hypothetical protein